MTDCPKRLDPIDCEALASGEAPVVAPDAAEHAASCPSCARLVAAAKDFLREIETGNMAGPGPDLAARVVRIRPFSRRERRDLRLWAGPAALSAAVFAAGIGVLAAPGISAGDQAGVTLAALAPAAALVRAASRAIAAGFSASPDSWSALSDAFSRQSTWGFAALLLLAPAGLALRRVLARSPRRG
ncbi:MAG TPA: hypothetical protein VE007_01840 [Thermoanaerobaculia bacterium]|nr:hypothetical protein [Thermoanaerobaculia bacterium]